MHNIKARRKRCADEEETLKAKRGQPKASLILTPYPPGNDDRNVHGVISSFNASILVSDTEDDDIAFQRNTEELTK